jgi:DNA repair ATPase RecN
MKTKNLTEESNSSQLNRIPMSKKHLIEHYCAFFNFDPDDLSPHQKRVIDWAMQLTKSYQHEISRLKTSHEKLELVVTTLHNDCPPSK